MISEARVAKLDRYFYFDRSARRKDFLLSSVVGIAILCVSQAIGVSTIYSFVICAMFIFILLLIRILGYEQPLRSTSVSFVQPVSFMKLFSFAALVGFFAIIGPGQKWLVWTEIQKSNEEIVQVIESSANPTAQRSALLRASMNLNRATATRQKPDETKLASLTRAILKSTNGNDTSPEAWQAAASLISYRSAALTNFQPSANSLCPLMDHSSAYSVPNQPTQFQLVYADCTFDLNDVDGFNQQISTVKMDEFSGGLPKIFHFIFAHATVKYDPSRPSIPFASLEFFDCRFEVKVQGTPLKRQQPILRTILASEGPRITIPGSLSPSIPPS